MSWDSRGSSPQFSEGLKRIGHQHRQPARGSIDETRPVIDSYVEGGAWGCLGMRIRCCILM